MKRRIAIYGLGKETEKNLISLSEKYVIVGLLDSFKTDGEAYGYPILNIEEAINQHIDQIIVVARPGSCRAIAGRIGALCRDKNIQLTDIKGNDLLAKKDASFCFDNESGYYRRELLELVDGAEAISFDLFDTLVTRQVLNQEDLFDILAFRVGEKGFDIKDFARMRLQAEIELSRECNPSLTDIYSYMQPDYSAIQIAELCDIEYELDRSLLIPRKDMIEVLNYAYGKGKAIYVTTDTYYTEKQIITILSDAGIDGKVMVLVSCEMNTCKSQELFEILKEKSICNNILHIGDSLKADIESASSQGIKAFHIYSVNDLYELTGELGLGRYVGSIKDRIFIGLLASKLFNSPFVFEESNINIKSLEEAGYILFAPAMVDFVEFIGECVNKSKAEEVLFSARDGYLLQQLYALMWPDSESTYFLTSRIAAVRSCIDNTDDLMLIENTQFTGSVIDRLYTRYGIEPDDKIISDDSSDDIMDYAGIIFENSVIKKDNYKKYIDKTCKHGSGDKLFVDMSARGTIQYLIDKLFDGSLKGVYFLLLEPAFSTSRDITVSSLYSEDDTDNNTIFNDFYILEPIISAPHPSVADFDNDGNPIFEEEVRSDREIEVMKQIQDGIIEFMRDYLKICPFQSRIINKVLAAAIMGLVHKLHISAEGFSHIRNIDSFVNRITDIEVEV